MIEPFQSDDVLLADIEAARAQPAALHLWWLGQSGFLLQHHGEHVLFDPYLSDSLTAKYATTDKPHVRMTRRVIDPERLAFVDLATSTHNHTDHLDAATLLPILRRKYDAHEDFNLVIPAANQDVAWERLKKGHANLEPLEAGQEWSFQGFRFTAVPAAHDQLTTDAQGRHVYLGYIVEAGGWCVYHSGDTVVYDGMVEWLEPFDIDVAILPINGKVGNMNGADAARLAKSIGAKIAIPCHYEMFEFNTADPREQFVPQCERIGQPYRVLRAGERLTLNEGKF